MTQWYVLHIDMYYTVIYQEGETFKVFDSAIDIQGVYTAAPV